MKRENAQGENNTHVGKNNRKEIVKIEHSTVNIIIQAKTRRNWIRKFIRKLYIPLL